MLRQTCVHSYDEPQGCNNRFPSIICCIVVAKIVHECCFGDIYILAPVSQVKDIEIENPNVVLKLPFVSELAFIILVSSGGISAVLTVIPPRLRDC